ncbi:MAG: DUF92 domain-containing protein [Thermoplasmatota archaeon]
MASVADVVALARGHAFLLLEIAAVGAIAIYTYRREMLNALGAFVAFAMGAAIVTFTNLWWLLLLFSLLGLASAATRFRFNDKQKQKVAEKAGGRRRSRNVIANGLIPTLVAIAAPFAASRVGPGPPAVAFVSAIAVACADTLASEFGSLSDRVYMITTMKRVPAGVDGGVSLAGTLAALGGATAIATLGLLFTGTLTERSLALPLTAGAFLLPLAMGFLGCQIDSYLGAFFEGDGYLNKEEVNLLSIAAGSLLGFGLAFSFV